MEQDTRERLIQLEAAIEHGQVFTAYRLEALERELAALKSKPDTITRIMGPGAWVKIGLAAALLVATLLATGDVGAALRAARMGVG